MKSITKIWSNSTFQSVMFGLLLTGLIIIIWDAPFQKYEINIDPFSSSNRWDDIYWFVGDFNKDGNSERIRCFNGINSTTMDVVHYDKNGNLTENYHFNNSNWSYHLKPALFDINADDVEDLLYFSTRNDSIFFNALNLQNFKPIIDHHYFNTFENKRENYAFISEFHEFGDFDKDGKNELFFTFDAGYGLYPRGVFKMSFPSLEIVASPTEYMTIFSMCFKDLNKDGIPEILTSCKAPGNSKWCKKFTDTISYITVLDYNLNFLFDPIPMPGVYSYVFNIPSQNPDSLFYVIYHCLSNNEEPFKNLVLNNTGEIVAQKSWNNISNAENRYLHAKIINKTPYVFFNGTGHFELTPTLDLLPEKLKANKHGSILYPVCFDLNNDGWDEWISWDTKENVSIYNEKTNEKLSFESPIKIQSNNNVYPFYENNSVTKYMFATRAGFFFFEYHKNPYYYLLYLVYLMLFLVLSGSIGILFHFQKKNIEKKWETEKQLTELQFSSVKNQLNPHFMFNALNSVAYLINNGQKEEAYDFLSVNSRMMQRVMDDAKEVKRTIKEELDFTKDYLTIQKHRFKEKFTYDINIHPGVDLSFKVPKMCIHTYVENALKHGFRNTKTDGKLSITITPQNKGILIQVSDNGMGRKEASKYNDSSGKGLGIMEEFYSLFEKYYAYKIDCKISDLNGGDEKSGTKVELIILKD